MIRFNFRWSDPDKTNPDPQPCKKIIEMDKSSSTHIEICINKTTNIKTLMARV